jgi:hypothetical protein
MDFLTN